MRFLLWTALWLAGRVAPALAASSSSSSRSSSSSTSTSSTTSATVSAIYPSATPTINYVDSIEVVFISTFKYPVVLVGCESYPWMYFVDAVMQNGATKGSVTFSSVGEHFYGDNGTATAFPWTCSISIYPDSTSSTVSSTTFVGATFVISSLAGMRSVMYEDTTTSVISDTSSSTATSSQAMTSASTITNGTVAATSAAAAATISAASTGLSAGAKAGIAIGSIAGAAVLAGIIAAIFFVRRRIRASEQRLEELQQQQQQQRASTAAFSSMGGSSVPGIPPTDSVYGSAAAAKMQMPMQQMQPMQQALQPPTMANYAVVPELPGDGVARYEMGSEPASKPASPYHD